LRHIKDVGRFNAGRLAGLEGHRRVDALCELNVVEQVSNVCNTTIVRNAWEQGIELVVHGWIYDIRDGILKNLITSVSSRVELGRMMAGTPD
jgi:carbonic anhydrase